MIVRVDPVFYGDSGSTFGRACEAARAEKATFVVFNGAVYYAESGYPVPLPQIKKDQPVSQHYIGIKQVFAYPEARNGVDGYHVVYDYGTPLAYHSWSPKDKFEAAYLPMGHDNDGSRISPEMVASLIDFHPPYTHGEKTTVVGATLKTGGFEMLESSSCVDPRNYSEAIGSDVCRRRIEDRVWHLLGFALQWARRGLQK